MGFRRPASSEQPAGNYINLMFVKARRTFCTARSVSPEPRAWHPLCTAAHGASALAFSTRGERAAQPLRATPNCSRYQRRVPDSKVGQATKVINALPSS